ncbi:SDR family NAD(P)-dependent oxidoreductase [Mycetocola manganoxydans]|uniref:SDR family NAD(P)-dependent oxidoreductase n=1 Tax=Mycetocola manganoxydans TaxID=699879 RepID=A0A3L6ZKW9_9MICO|nr:SDR family oxidoreductase [Mycetocola manganoxydans]RLP68295.1 SDR family NAD(P)-dependent oxidoreductase [Mycetocola manganoxydans]GHD43556.1 short-chain dehydrogenase [Mycetocola manganoxydans]
MSKNTVVVITGASSGIGRATALRYASAGANVVLASRRGQALTKLAKECEARGGDAIAVPTDVTNASQVDALARAAVMKFGRIDVWVNNAAVSAFAPFLEMPLDDIRRVLDVNILGYIYGVRAALAVMTEQGRGSLINVASIVGEVPQPYTAPYGMSKAAVRALGVSLRSELALQKQKHISVSTILPATIDTPFFRHSANYTGRQVVAMPPVYSPDLVAKLIVRTAKKPRNEAIAAGPIGKSLVTQHRKTPAPVEAQMALQTDKTHLSRKNKAPSTDGTLYSPAPTADATATGGWKGSERTGKRSFLGSLTAAALGVAVARWILTTNADASGKKRGKAHAARALRR